MTTPPQEASVAEKKEKMMMEWKGDADWRAAFVFAENVRVAKDCKPDAFSIDDVATVLHKCEGENDGQSWIMAGILNDGRYFFLSAWCDYTGWDCQAGGDSQVAGNEKDLYRYCMDEDARKRFGIKLEES